MDDGELALLLSKLEPRGRDVLRRLVRADQRERDEFGLALLRERAGVGRDLADLLDIASFHPEVRQQVARVLGQLEAG